MEWARTLSGVICGDQWLDRSTKLLCQGDQLLCSVNLILEATVSTHCAARIMMSCAQKQGGLWYV